MPRFGILALAALASAGAAVRTPNAGGLQDLAAYPKYEVVFLNDQPLSASDAARCRSEGLVNDDDFLVIHPRSRATIEAEAAARGEAESESDNDNDDDDDNDNNDNGNENAEDGGDSSDAMPSNIELMTLHYTHQGETGAHAYLCALPSANRTAEQATSAAQPHDEPQPDAAASWLALSHLDGQCLYVRHRWFTYAYCHNKYIRQFREAQMTVAAPPEGHTPREDPAYDAYTLGYAHPPKRKAAQRRKDKAMGGAAADSQALAPEQTATFGVGSASRYLVQRWTDGTRCDKTGAAREVEVQVHCSMTSGDSIYMVKEVEICKYVVVIHSPHLCSLPGFRPQTADDIDSVPIRCREVLSDEDFARWEAEPEEQRKLAAAAENPLRLSEPPPADEPKQKQFTFKHRGAEVKVEGEGDTAHPNAIELEVDVDLVKRLEEILTKAFGDNLEDLGVEVQYRDLGEAGEFGEEFVPKQVEPEGGEADAQPAAGGGAAAEGKRKHKQKQKQPVRDDPPVLFLEYDEETGKIKPADPPETGDPQEGRRAMLERLQKMIEIELGQGDAEAVPEDEATDHPDRRAKDEL